MAALSERHAEILDGYTDYLDTETALNETTAAHLRWRTRRYLLWLQTQDLEHDPLGGDPAARDTAVGFYKRSLFGQGQKVAVINMALANLRTFYTWWGPGPHQVPLLVSGQP